MFSAFLCFLTVSTHALGHTLLQAAALAAVAAGAVDGAVALTRAGVRHAGLLTPPEKALKMEGGWTDKSDLQTKKGGGQWEKLLLSYWCDTLVVE